MGVPVVTFNGRTAVGRGGASVLSNLSLRDLIGADEREYFSIAVRMAKDAEALASMRQTLRERMQSSALVNAPQFAAEIETAYRRIWQAWCERQ
jgi:predicted O-linked N-acetylglucosamine transferase (SPINDLY family)